ncbi:MAG: HIT family protein [Candidatus Doudnabacteria bacterium]|nr:HIT family protein [Candidatus Doudnabacteria bacterium]
MKDCIFCKIVSGEIDSAKIWEDENFLAILDINPNVEGMTLVLTKKHFDSYMFDFSDQDYTDSFLAARKVAGLLEKGLNVKRVSMVMEGMGINHAHIKLYPLYGIDEKFEEIWAKEKVYFEKYEGYISTQLGPQKNLEELNQLADKIKKHNLL